MPRIDHRAFIRGLPQSAKARRRAGQAGPATRIPPGGGAVNRTGSRSPLSGRLGPAERRTVARTGGRKGPRL